MRALLTAAVILVAGLGLCSAVCADLPYSAEVSAVKSTTTPNTWTYTVHNTSTESQFVLWVFGIEVDDQADVLNTVTPAGWVVDTDSQPHFVTWMYMAGELAAGGMKSGFEAQFSGTPVFQNYTALLNNVETSECPVAEGIVQVPEPMGLAALLTGLAPVAALAFKRRRG